MLRPSPNHGTQRLPNDDDDDDDLNRIEHTDKITVLQCCPVQYKVQLCNTKK